MSMKTLHEGEVIYLGSSYSSKQGIAKITLQVGKSPSVLEVFEGHENKRYMIALVEIGNDEQPTYTEPYKKEDTRGPLCKWAVLRCKEPLFWEFLSERFDDMIDSEESAKEWLLMFFGIDSRKELDSDSDVSNHFHYEVRTPWAQWLKEREPVGAV